MTFFEPEIHPLQHPPQVLCAEVDSGLLSHRSLQLAQCPIGITRQQSSQHFLVESAVATRSVPRPLHSFAALAGRRNLPSPTAAHAKAQCQLGQACLPLVVSLQQLPSQIVRIRSRHGCSCRRSSPVTLYTIERNSLKQRNLVIDTGFDHGFTSTSTAGRVSPDSPICFRIDSGVKGTASIDLQNIERWYEVTLYRRRSDWEARIFRLKSVAILLAMAPVCAFAQRHSGGSEQGYYTKPPNPILNIDDQLTKTWSYPRLSDLMNMKRTTVEVPDPKTHQKDSYVGVALKELIPNSSGHRFDVLESTWAFRDRLAVSSADLDMQSEVVVPYAENGKKLAGNPFYFIAKNAHGDLVVISKLSYIRLDKTP